MLEKQPGSEHIYRSNDSGSNQRYLKSCPAPKVLKLKTGCTVVLLHNLFTTGSVNLVNGLQGVVTNLLKDGPQVVFEDRVYKLKQELFSVIIEQ